jgi:hypothetical protein
MLLTEAQLPRDREATARNLLWVHEASLIHLTMHNRLGGVATH